MKAYRIPLLLVAVAIVLGGVYFFLDWNADPVQAGKLYRFAGSERLREMTVTNRYGSYKFEKENGKWVITQPARYRVNPQKAALMEQALLELPVNRMLGTETEEYGLAHPAAIIGMVSDQNTQHTLYIGNPTPSMAQVYLKDVDTNQVTVSNLGNVAMFDGSLDAYRDKEVFSIHKSMITGITFYKNGEKKVAVERVGDLDWQMVYPYQVPARRVELSQLVAQMQKWSIAEYPAQDTASAMLGLDKPEQVLEIGDASGNTQRLEFGKIADGKIAVRTGGEHDIAQLYAVDVNFETLTPERLIFVAPLRTSIDNVTKIAVEYSGKAATFGLDHSTTPPRITANGIELEYSDFVSFFVKYIGLSADGYDEKTQAGAAYMTLTTTFHDGSMKMLTLRERDANSFFMDMDGQAEFFAGTEQVKQLVYLLEAALASKK